MTGRTNAGGGVQLPALTNPAAAGNIQSGYQAINGEGEIVTGTAAVRETVVGKVTNEYNRRVYWNTLSGVDYRSFSGSRNIHVLKNGIIICEDVNECETSGDITEVAQFNPGGYDAYVFIFKVSGPYTLTCR